MPTNAKILGFRCFGKLVKKDCGIRSIDRPEIVSHKKLLAFGTLEGFCSAGRFFDAQPE